MLEFVNWREGIQIRVGLAAVVLLSVSAAARAQRYEVLHEFAGTDGVNPSGPHLQGSDGNFYGTTRLGGTNDWGTVFRMDAAGNVTTLHSFVVTDGAQPTGALIQATDGNIYGTTVTGGIGDCSPSSRFQYACGTAFQMDLSDNVTTFYDFGGGIEVGTVPASGLIQAADGNFYGTAPLGGTGGGCAPSLGCGTVFKLDPAGNATTLHLFQGSDGSDPETALIQASDGSLFGTTAAGGESNVGTVFKLDLSGNFTTLHDFHQGEGGNPTLIQARDGNFYGTTFETAFRMDTSGNVTVLHSFNFAEGLSLSALLEAADGNFYGTAAIGGNVPCALPGGSDQCGTIFRMDPSGNVTVLHQFRGDDGAVPLAALIQGSDGNLYGMTSQGGPGNVGVVFRLEFERPSPRIGAASRCPNPGGCRANP